MSDDSDHRTDPREGAGSDVKSEYRLTESLNAAGLIVLTIVGAFLANGIVSQFSRYRIDMTENNIYTLSEPSKQVVRSFDESGDEIQVKAYISANMPPPMHTLRRRVRDILTEYKAASGGSLDFEIVSPNADELTDKEQKELEQEAKGYGCEKVGLRSGGEERVSLQTVFKCVAFITNGGKKQEVIKNLSGGGQQQQQGQMNFEYEFTKTLMNLQGREARKVAFVKGFGGIADRRGFTRKLGQRFQQLFDGLIEATSVDLSKENPTIPEDVSALILLNPSKSVSDKAKFKIDQFLQQGGSVGWFQSPTGKSQQRGRRRRRMPGGRKPLKPGLRDFFADYGLKLRKDTVFDRQNGMVTIARVDGKRGLVRHPATFTTRNINRSLPFTKNFGTLGFPAPSSIQVQAKATDSDDMTVHKIVQSEDTAIRRPEQVTDLSITTFKEKKESDEQGTFVLAAALKGNLPSYFADKEPPQGMSKSDGEQAASSRLMVVGSGSLLQPQNNIGYKRRMAALGQRFFFASLEWLAQDTALARIRGKSLPRLIDDVDASKKRWIQFINIAGVPAIFALIGVLMMFRRRGRRRALRR